MRIRSFRLDTPPGGIQGLLLDFRAVPLGRLHCTPQHQFHRVVSLVMPFDTDDDRVRDASERCFAVTVLVRVSLNSCLRQYLQSSGDLYSIAAAASSYGNEDPESKGTQDDGAEFLTRELSLVFTCRHLSSSIVTSRPAPLATKCPRLPSTVVTCYQVSFCPHPEGKEAALILAAVGTTMR